MSKSLRSYKINKQEERSHSSNSHSERHLTLTRVSEVCSRMSGEPPKTETPDDDARDLESRIKVAMRSRVSHFKEQSE